MQESLRRHVWALPIEAIMFGGALFTAAGGNLKHFLASVFTLFTSFLPLYIERKYKVALPVIVHVLFVVFVFSSMFAGEVLNMYANIAIWDDVIHFLSGVIIGASVMLWLTFFESSGGKKNRELPNWLGGALIFMIIATIAVTWELVEFSSDQIFSTFSQGNDLFDTMADQGYALVSGIIMAFAWISYKIGRRPIGLATTLDHFKKLNHIGTKENWNGKSKGSKSI